MTALFVNGPDITVRGRDGLNWTVLAYIDIRLSDGTLYRVPIGCSTDGASTPRFLWSLGIPPFGSYWPAAVVHDAAFRNLLLVWKDNQWVQANLTEEQANDLLNALMICLCVDDTIREEIYLGVKLGGFAAYRKDRLQTITIPPQPPVALPGPPAHAPG